ncbi:MAG: hypothetical protein H6850_03310 [Alphaproteobacteria bacterium]|nr:MAG: hypothetical protein H6850_03310 [Alphaproteobacteria bacterium]
MEKKSMSRAYQENLLINLIDQFNEISAHQASTAKKILVSMRYFMTNFIIDEDIIDEMSGLVDQIMHKLDTNENVFHSNIHQTSQIKAND